MVSNGGGRRKVCIIGTNLERCPLGSVSEFYLGKLGKALVCRNQIYLGGGSDWLTYLRWINLPAQQRRHFCESDPIDYSENNQTSRHPRSNI